MTVVSIALVVATVGVFAGSWTWSLLKHRRQGGTLDFARTRVARLEIARSCAGTRQLIYDGLLNALGTRTPPRKKHRDDFKIRSHLDGRRFGPGSALFHFQLEPLSEERTRLTLSLSTMSWGPNGGPPDPEEAPARARQVDRLANWLAEHGDGRVVENGWGHT